MREQKYKTIPIFCPRKTKKRNNYDGLGWIKIMISNTSTFYFYLRSYLQHLGSCHDDLLLAIGTKLHNVTETKKLYEQTNKQTKKQKNWLWRMENENKKIKQKQLNIRH